MTTKDKIKALIAADKEIAQVIGALLHLCDYEDKQENASLLALADRTVQEVINALFDELPDHIADPGKKGATLPDGTPINLCGGDKC